MELSRRGLGGTVDPNGSRETHKTGAGENSSAPRGQLIKNFAFGPIEKLHPPVHVIIPNVVLYTIMCVHIIHTTNG